MLVTFHKLVEKRLSTWEAVRGRRTRIPGTTMGLGRGDLPHDLAQMIVEALLGIEHGFWGCVAQGATFKSLGRKRTRPGRAIIAANREKLAEAELATSVHLSRWRRGESTPASAALDRFDKAWHGLEDGGHLIFRWPSLELIES